MVFGGPFAGMKLTNDLELCKDPKIIVGSYEEELHEIVNRVICSSPQNIIDIGSAFGYYAVGFALKISNAKITAFEMIETPHWQQLAELARINDVSNRITQRGTCNIAALLETCQPGTFVICDCEGAEEDLLQPMQVPALRSCRIVVELHECYRPKLVATLVERFRDSHHVSIIEERDRDPSRYRILKTISPKLRALAIEETRFMPGTPVNTPIWLRFMDLTPKH
jgi:hypothetical protein